MHRALCHPTRESSGVQDAEHTQGITHRAFMRRTELQHPPRICTACVHDGRDRSSVAVLCIVYTLSSPLRILELW